LPRSIWLPRLGRLSRFAKPRAAIRYEVFDRPQYGFGVQIRRPSRRSTSSWCFNWEFEVRDPNGYVLVFGGE